ncbi:MAG: hypothetical protein SF123_23200 [Chloroflexota bacterium]|nr:hypothetical protein [Chloroflexota bacterium]
MNEMKWILLIHVGATLMMAGVIWIIQVVHYPLFDRVGSQTYTAYQSGHMSLITCIVMPLMLAELVTAGLLVLAQPPGVTPVQAWVGLVLVGVVWFMTAFVNVPQHSTLAIGFDSAVHQALVTTNWVRTLAWSARGVLVLWMVSGAMR